MMKRLEIDSLKADLAAVGALLACRTPADDSIGWIQYSSRKTELQRQIAEIESKPDHHASVALFFGGRPVIGSRGIIVEFAGKMLEKYQEMVSKRNAAIELGEPLSSRGTIPKRANAQMMVTEVARGSFGFVLEEASQENELVETSLKHVVNDISDLIHKLSQEDEEGFETVAETLDDRLLISIRGFFKTLDDAGATMKLVDGHKEFILQREDVERARARTDSMEVAEKLMDETGVIYLLPDGRRFDFYPDGDLPVRRGVVSAACLKGILGDSTKIPDGILGVRKKAGFKVREVKQRNSAVRISYTLTQLADVV